MGEKNESKITNDLFFSPFFFCPTFGCAFAAGLLTADGFATGFTDDVGRTEAVEEGRDEVDEEDEDDAEVEVDEDGGRDEAAGGRTAEVAGGRAAGCKREYQKREEKGEGETDRRDEKLR